MKKIEEITPKFPAELLAILKSLSMPISTWNPLVGFILSTVTNNLEYSNNKKLIERIKMICETINEIQKKEKEEKINYEAKLICPELFRQSLICENRDRAKSYLRFTKKLFSAGEINFDNVNEALKIFFTLSESEYKILPMLPDTYLTWEELFSNNTTLKEMSEKNTTELESTITNLILKNLANIETVNILGHNAFNRIDFEGNDGSGQQIAKSAYGKKFLETIAND